MKLIRITAATAAAISVSACNLIEFYRVEPLTIRAADLPKNQAGEQIVEAPGGVLRSVNLDSFKLKIGDATLGINEVQTKEQRNAWISFLLNRSAEQCDYHQAAIITTQSAVNGIAGGTAGVLGGAGALVTGATAARILSGSAGAVTGLRAQYNEVVYQNLISTAVIRKIEELRAPKRADIKKAMEADIGRYNIHQALLDINEYHTLCSFHVGLVALTDDKQSLRPLTGSLEAQINSAKEAIEDLETRIDNELAKLANPSSQQASVSNARIEEWRRSIRDQEAIRRSAQNQLSIAATLSGDTGKKNGTAGDAGSGGNGAGTAAGNANGATPPPAKQ